MDREPQPSTTETAPASGREGRPVMLCGPARHLLFGLGLLATGLGIAGLVLPGMPGTVFLIVALWAFSRSSERLQLWLYDHPRFGASLRAWHAHKVIPRRAKLAAVGMMAVSQALLTVLVAEGWVLPVVTATILGLVSAWILTRPSRAPV